ncbi:CBASS cGAMP-activated phospholipase [Rheinheimera pleomorphica]|uniref:CBASS cGAMP-activated phospholipase n=1 Tax=Rheinheimera pleomorphica TaxID=2703963 RepID=UPI00141FA689|nr:CBASS cGAMP-activated phospholipase [Rheinheimera pleomorphica]
MLNMLCLTGGGYRGLYTAAVIRSLEKEFDTEIKKQCDCIAGTSIGGIIAIGLALGKSSDDIITAFQTYKADIFKSKGWYHNYLYSSRYTNDGLKKAINAIFGDFAQKTMQDLKARSGIDLLITTVELNTGKTLLINTIDDDYKSWTLEQVALATSAAPTFFPAFTRSKIRYIDGGVICNMPDIVAAQTYSRMRAVSLDEINILSIGTCYLSEKHCTAKKIADNAGGIRWARNLEYFINIQAPLVRQQCEALFMKHRYARLDFQLDAEIKLDDISGSTERKLLDAAKLTTSQTNILQNDALLQFMTIR